MNEEYLFLDYLWDLQPDYFHMKEPDADVAFNRPLIQPEKLDSLFLTHLQADNVFIEPPILRNHLYIGLTKKGSLVWEDYYKVQWRDFINYDVEDLENNSQILKIYAKTKDNLLSVFPELNELLLKNLQEVDYLQVTYWKTLERGFKSYAFLSNEDEVFDGPGGIKLPRWRIEAYEK